MKTPLSREKSPVGERFCLFHAATGLLAITACPTGIAHTYMAAAAILTGSVAGMLMLGLLKKKQA